MNSNISIFLLLLLYFSCLISCQSCAPGVTSVSCTEDLSGYLLCKDGRMTEVTCPDDTQCRCSQEDTCEEMQPAGDIKVEDICVPVPSPFPMKRVLHLTYKTGGWKQVDPFYTGYHHFEEEGDVRQDLNKQKSVATWGIPEYRRFKYILPDGSGKFTEVTGKYPNKCVKRTLPEFPEFASDIKNYQMKEMKQISSSFSEQVWKEEEEYGETREWIIFSDSVDKVSVPLKYREAYTTEDGEMCCSYDKFIEYEKVTHKNDEDTDEWFHLPDFCRRV